MLYFLSCAYNRHNIRLCYVKCLDVLSYNKNTCLKMSSVFIISGMHLFWLVVFFVNSMTTQEPAINLVLHAQDFVCFMFEMQFYVILLLVKSSLEMVIHRISNFFHMIKENKIDTKLILPDYFANCLEDTRLLHMEIFDIMVNVNRIYGLNTLTLIIQSRILLAINLYSYITSFSVIDLVESMATFQRVALLCYCCELIKQNENIIKSMVNEMDTNLLPGENYKQQRLLFNHQAQKLKFDLDVLDMFPINLETLLSILITTASYLLLFSQLNLTLQS
ncbi:uncharacterized protein LOC111034243 isoform X1 [Myzus persicae]|uniref:uncharacterized protein LOC111034243 isoform X1 n=1 Tax=Myzus persicae TaxID=13164 RepID=UPI000B933FC3|nr:uncharacterized protein LOC111034243 isoform X1 [Myzus persicae]